MMAMRHYWFKGHSGGLSMRTKRVLGLVGACLLLAAMPALAHHSFKAQYDESQMVTVSGTVTKVSWRNPHVLVFVDVKDDAGKVANWEMELASPNGLMRQGWKLDSLKQGDQVTVSGFPAKDGSHVANARKVILSGHGQMFEAAPESASPSK
jgi:hypothetical protein